VNAAYIKPFIQGIRSVFGTMVNLEVAIGTPTIKSEPLSTYDVSGVIGISGEVVGSIVLSFPAETAQQIVARFSGEECDVTSPDFADAVGELVNMVSGAGKADLPHKGASISCPSVVVGKNHRIATGHETPCVVVPCKTECGQFVIEIALKEATVGAAAA